MNEIKLNRKYIYYNLQEAQEEIDILLKNILKENYDHEQFYKSFQHLVHHVNIAWNARGISSEATSDPSDEEMLEWSKFPTDLKII